MLELRLTEAQNRVYREISNGITAKHGSSMNSLIAFIRYGVKLVQSKKDDINAKINENNDTLSVRLADEANRTLRQEYKAYTDDIKAVLNTRKTAFFDAKREALAQFVKKMPSDNLSKKLQYICDFGNLFDKSIWEIFITDPEIASNYLASSIVQKKAEENGIDYVSGFNYSRLQEKLSEAEAMISNSIPHIGEDKPSLILLSLLSENPNSPVAQLILYIDSDIATISPAERRTVLKRLKEAEKHAYETDNLILSTRIKGFIERNLNELSTPEELKDALYEQAEDFISRGMSAKKGDE